MSIARFLESHTTNQTVEKVFRRRALLGYAELASAMIGATAMFFTDHVGAGTLLVANGLVGGYLGFVSDNFIRQWKTGGPEFATPLEQEMSTLLFGGEAGDNNLEWPKGTHHGDEGKMTDADVHFDL